MVAPQAVPFLQTCTPFNFHKNGEHLIRNLATNNEKTPAEMTLWGLYTSFRLFIKSSSLPQMHAKQFRSRTFADL